MTSNNSPSLAALEFLTVEEFADRLKVSRTTVFGWLKNGELREGVHYLRLGRILRFRWPFFNNPQPQPQPSEDYERQPASPHSPPRKRKRPHRKRGAAPAINLDY